VALEVASLLQALQRLLSLTAGRLHLISCHGRTFAAAA
jgi:hypothetical protein